MTALAVEFGPDGRDGARWGVSFVVVCLLHVGVAAALWHARIELAPAEPAPEPVVMIDLAPLPAPQPTPVPVPPPPPPPEPQMVEEPPPPPPVKAEVVIPKPPPPKPQRKRPPEKVEPPPMPAPVAAPKIEAPPVKEVPQAASIPSDAMPSWEAQVLARIERFKRYPRRAQLRQQQGIAHIRFTVGRQGDVLNYALQRSSGIDSLDEETLALIERAKPFPAPPLESGRESVELVVPVRYFLK